MSIKYQVELCLNSLDADTFFTTQSPHPFCIAVGDEIAGDAIPALERNESVKLNDRQRLVVKALRHYLFTSDGSLPARNLRLMVSCDPVS